MQQSTLLTQIIASKKKELIEIKRRVSFHDIKNAARDAGAVRGFAKALSTGGDTLRIIAEVKKASPSKGVIRQDFDPIEIAKTYEEHGASCISVLTESRFFQGSLGFLPFIREAVKLPLLRKDFIIDAYQIYEARVAGADAILLIAGCLDKRELEDFIGMATELHLDVLVESHSYSELDKTLNAGALLVGINNRDLATFKVDLQTTLDLLKDIPDDRIVVSESGITNRSDILRLEKAGVDAVLVGEALMREQDIGAKLKELTGN
ncbi:MAG: indole-3-glycerol phosphate synthase TrpC [Nitrospirota bacterium]